MPASERVFLGGTELAGLMREFDWAGTSIGSPEHWPESLKTAVRIILTSRQPFWIGWGRELIYFYNDPYKSIIGGKHPWALGRPTSVVWREIWNDIGPMLDTAMGGEEGTYVEEQLLIMERNGYPEETYYTFSYSPILLEDGTAGGIICANSDDTRRVIGERQLALLRVLATDTAEARSWQQACERAAGALSTNSRDLPFAMIYIVDPDGATASLAGLSGIERGHPAAPASIPLDASTTWPIAAALASHAAQFVSDLAPVFRSEVPKGAWGRAPSRAVVLPIPASVETGRAGALIVGLNPFRLFDESYSGFLDLVVGQIAAALTNAEAYEAERRRAEVLAEIDRAKTTFFSNVSHEFRTPLTLMLGPLEELLSRKQDGDPSDRDLVETAHRNGLRLLKLVNSLLDFSRIEAGRVQAHYHPTDLAALTAEIASSFRSAADQAGLRFTIACEPLPEPVYVDPDMWEKIVLNLVSNAFKFTFDGEIAIRVRPSADGTAAQLIVRDTGTGIPEHELPHLFERFHRIEGARGRTFEGSGIGLALVQELVKLHGGSIAVESEPGQGTAFTITLPFGSHHLPKEHIDDARVVPPGLRAHAYVEEALSWLPREDAAGAAGPLTQSIIDDLDARTSAAASGRVLLADDNADMRGYVGRLLADAGYEVEAVGDGDAALAAVRRCPPDLVLSDVMMPGLDGFGLLRALRADPATRDIPLMLLSARAGEEAKLEGLQSGADDYLVKPFGARELLARVATNLNLARARAQHAMVLREEAHRLNVLNRTAAVLAAELELEPLVQAVTDAATELTGAKFGAFFYNVTNDSGESYLLYTLSGASREDFAGFPQPRNTEVFGPTFRGEGIVRSGDIRKDPRYGKNAPNKGPPKGHLPVVSYLAVSVVAPTGEVLGGLFFAHPEPDRFTEQHETIVAGIAAQAAVAFEKARLYRASRTAETELRRLNETLEQRVAEEIERRRHAESELRQAQKMEAIGQLTGGVAHDMNNLLLVIQGSLERLDRYTIPIGSDAERAVQMALRGVSRAASLTNQLLAFARRQPLDPRPVEANRLVASMSDLLRRSLGETIAIETVLAGGLWRTFADPNQIETAILNLAVNARDAMPDGGRLTIETANSHLDEAYAQAHHEVTPGQYVMIAVSDTGTGMSKEECEKAFEPFFTTKQPGRGTGLGLSQVYGFVKQSGGHVKIYSEPGQGTTVRMYLPRYRGDAAAAATQSDRAPILAARSSESILVVEDDADVRANSVESLRELGYQVVEAGDAAEGLRIIERDASIRLLFTDIGLPGGLNGRQLADAARQRRPDLKVLFTTGYARNAIVHHGRLDPGVELLVKPYTYAELAAKIRAVLDGGGSG